MTYKEVTLITQLHGTYRCATTVLVRTVPRKTISHVVSARASFKQRGDSSSRGGSCVEKGDTPTKGVGANGSPASVSTLSSEGLRCSLWLARSDGDIEIRSSAVPNSVLELVPHKERTVVTSLLQISHNCVVAALSDGVLRVIDAVSLQDRQSMRAHKSAITCMLPVTLTKVQRSQEETQFTRISAFVTASSDFTIATWDSVTLGCLRRMKGHSCGVTALAVTVSGAFLFSGGEDGSLRMWSLVEGVQVVGKSTSHKSTKKATKRKGMAVSLSEHPQQDVKKNKELLLPLQKGRYHAVGQTTDAEVHPIHRLRSLSAQTATRTAATRAATPSTGRLWVTPTRRKVSAADVAVSPARRSSMQATASTLRNARALCATPRACSVGTNRKALRTMSATAGERNPRKRLTKTSKSKPTTPRPGVVPCVSEVEAVMSEADDNDDDDDDDEKGGSDEDDKCNAEVLERARQISRIEDGEGASTAKELGSGAVGEGTTARMTSKAKKSRKHREFNFGTILQQLVGNTVTDPVIQRLLDKRHSSGGGDDAVLLWPLKYEHLQRITGLALVRDRILVTASCDGVAKMFALPAGRMLCTIHRSRAALTGLVVDELHCRLWIGSADGCVAVYDALHPDAGQLHGWRDLITPRPQLVPLVSHVSLGHLYVFARHADKISLGQSISTHKDMGSGPSRLHPWKASPIKHSSLPAVSCGNKVSNSTLWPTLTCVRLDDEYGGVTLDVPLMQSLDEQFESARSFFLGNSLREGVFRRILRRSVTEEAEEIPGYLKKEKAKAASALEVASAKLLLQRAFSRWQVWRARRVARYRRLRIIRFLESLQQERILGTMFRRWKLLSLSTRRSLHNLDMAHIEKRLQCVSFFDSRDETRDVANSVRGPANALGGAEQRRLLQRYFFNWLRYMREMRRSVVQRTAFNRLFLYFCDVTFGDGFFVWRRLGAAAEVRLRRRRAFCLLEKYMAPNQYKWRIHYLRRWMQYAQNQKEGRHSLVLVEPLSSVLVDEGALRIRFYLKWYRYALFEARLLRLDEERTTMQREWIAVQNAVDSTASVEELCQEKEHLELEIAQLAFERDGVECHNLALRTDIDYLQVQKSLDCLLSGYRDSLESLHRRRDSGSVSRCKISSNTSRDGILPFMDDDAFDGELATLRQVGAVLRALKAAGIRCGRHRALIMASYERAVQLPIFEYLLETPDYNSSNMSVCSTGGESSVVRTASTAPAAEGRLLTDPRRGSAAYANAPLSLAGEFDRTVQRLRTIIVSAARLTGIDLSAPFDHDSLLSVPEGNPGRDEEPTDSAYCTSLCWLKFVPPTTRTEALPLILDLVAMFDSFKAHSDAEVEGAGRKLSTRGAPKVMPLALRSLCKPKNAVWLVRHAAVLLELMFSGFWQRHLQLQALATEVAKARMTKSDNGAVEPSSARSAEIANTSENLRRTKPSGTGTTRPCEGKPRKTFKQPFPNVFTDELKIPKERPRSMSWTATETGRTNSKMLLSSCGRGTAQRKFFIYTEGSLTPRPQKHSPFNEDDDEGPRTYLPIPLPSSHLGRSTPIKAAYGFPTTRPYLGFRVAVGRDDTQHTTLTVSEVAESYICATDGTTRQGPAFASGLRAGDQLLRFAGYAVTELAAFNVVVARHVRPWARIPVHFLRDSQIMTATIVVGEKARNG
ncbi:hypothetical protein TraAM80_00474 [Trypanosoma rangeli]|uniref:Uncharacterized protein n=1 Tax=Trypanosoma rangeli TaxID=5698 RepID=A0A422P395_TRYRA|nr:uncharacterized protein TraAM80_00474 [Trypanosoma rangeli]RNF12193.1 hypothetical protein TraAM80_00474 [Trypanosoma rangeli]|eukprot:RNF12193.1 hypothetical protein TraAM80_00474 [Trypanosoma rangeli]